MQSWAKVTIISMTRLLEMKEKNVTSVFKKKPPRLNYRVVLETAWNFSRKNDLKHLTLYLFSLHMICYVKPISVSSGSALLLEDFMRGVQACHKLILLQPVLRACFCKQLWKWISISFFLKKKKKNMIYISLLEARGLRKMFVLFKDLHK